MTRHHDSAEVPDNATDGSVTYRSKVHCYGPMFAQVREAAAVPQGDDTTIWNLYVAYDYSGEKDIRFEDRLPSHFTFAKGTQVPIWVGKHHRDGAVVDQTLLLRILAESAAQAEQSLGVDAERFRPSWRLPARCPNCGAAIDQVVQASSPDPHCDFCREPIPVE
jgi:hypothetical protein